MKDRPFALIGINVVGHGAKQLKEVMTREKLPWRSFADPGENSQGAIATSWNLSGTPTLYVLDHRGVIRRKWVGSPGEGPIDAALDALLREAESDAKK